MINLQSALGAPPVVFPRVGMPRIGMPGGMPGNAPVTSMAAQAGAQCPSCTRNGTMMAGVGDLAPGLWARIPLWAKIAGGVTLAGGLGFLVWRLVR